MPEIRYQRLTRSRARSVFAVALQSRVSLWLAEDHLLCVDTNGYTETYKRFYFRDIQSISIRETTRRTVWNGVLILPIAVCFVGLLMSISPARSAAGMIVWSIFAALFLVPFVINNIRGTTCACQLRTAVQIEELPSLCRVRKTRRILEKIRPLIAAAQGGELPADAVSARMRDWALSPAEASPAAETAPAKSGIPPRLDL